MANWNKIKARGNVSDRRGVSGTLVGGGIGGVLLLMGVTYLLGGNPLDVLLQTDPAVLTQSVSQEDAALFAGVDEYEEFVSTVLGSTDEFWTAEFAQQGRQYTRPELVLFRGSTQSGCGGAAAMIGPHYCPVDSTIYLDETFFIQLQTQLGAIGGDVAEAYVIAHEVGHHVQNVSGFLDYDRRDNQNSIQVELQADCFAGLWASSLKNTGIFENENEIKEAIDAASAVGDDRIQAQTQGQVSPETWTHGSSQDRMQAFVDGYNTGDYAVCVQ
jgi:hypothetical protein